MFRGQRRSEGARGDVKTDIDWTPYAHLGQELEETQREFRAYVANLRMMWERGLIPRDEDTIFNLMRGALLDAVAGAAARHAQRRVILILALRRRVAQLRA